MQVLHMFRSYRHFARLFKRFNYWFVFCFLATGFLSASIPTFNSAQAAIHFAFPATGKSCDAGVKTEDTQRHLPVL